MEKGDQGKENHLGFAMDSIDNNQGQERQEIVAEDRKSGEVRFIDILFARHCLEIFHREDNGQKNQVEERSEEFSAGKH